MLQWFTTVSALLLSEESSGPDIMECYKQLFRNERVLKMKVLQNSNASYWWWAKKNLVITKSFEQSHWRIYCMVRNWVNNNYKRKQKYLLKVHSAFWYAWGDTVAYIKYHNQKNISSMYLSHVLTANVSFATENIYLVLPRSNSCEADSYLLKWMGHCEGKGKLWMTEWAGIWIQAWHLIIDFNSQYHPICLKVRSLECKEEHMIWNKQLQWNSFSLSYFETYT